MVAFERLPEDVFVRVGSAQPPAWFGRRFADASRIEPASIAEAWPFLEDFLADAEDVWSSGGKERLRSDSFTMTDTPGKDVALVASAVVVASRCFLILESPYDFEERRRALQTARELVLAHEAHLKRTGALLAPVDAARRLTQQLTTSGLSPEQQELAAGIGQQLSSLAESLESLAPLPKGVSRRSRR
jgi:hypothetical protein